MATTDDGSIQAMSARTTTGQVDPLQAMIDEINAQLSTGRAARLALTDRVTSLEGRTLRMALVSGAGAIALTGFTAAPAVLPIATWSGAQMIIGAASNVTKDGFTATVMRSKGTLLLTVGPFEAAPAGVNASFLVIGT